ncbi:autophagy-related protein 11-domain-containing protein [Triangularia verruculosa]|uniref:Autophagy-related protein 11 n=1 Tax=Triangularia verruculosa TaxID=2587418 RepID=A0AAN6XDF8_9PEZI|nr:autophagy-related protein 11-domain-containing protein [Triangularia verruculosa]
MASQVLIAHTGQRLHIDASQASSLDDLKAAIASQISIPTQYIITLTPQGRPLKPQAIHAEKEIYVYDSRLALGSSPGTPPPAQSEVPIPKDYRVSDAPDFIENSRSIQAWQDLYKTRRVWVFRVLEDCRQMAVAADDRYSEIDVMLRCLDAAVTNLESVIRGLEPKYSELTRWIPTAQADYAGLAAGWEEYLSLARSLPVSSAMVRFMTGREANSTTARLQRQATLEDLVDLETARRAGRQAPAALRKFNNRVADLDKAATRLFQDAEDLFREFERTMERSAMGHSNDAHQLLQDIEAVAKKIDTDYQTTLEYTSSSREALSQASKIAVNHTERLLPTIGKRAVELSKMLQYATQARNTLAAESTEFMRTIADITSLSSSVKAQISGVNQEDELSTFDHLRLLQQGPYMYASFVVESIRRREWLEKVKQDSATLANEMALFQEEEMKRRRRWYKSIANAYGPKTPAPESHVPGLEVNLLGEEDHWPSMTRGDLEEFFGLLQTQKADAEIVSDVEKLVAELNNPTRQQSKRMKAFKNGSVHEAALGRSGLLIRGDDDLLRSLQDDKSKLENKLKTAESRVRRLEDLLHRQTQASRPSIGNLFHPPSQHLPDRNDSTISVRSPRISEDRRGSLEGADGLAQRIQQLEADLGAEKERSMSLEKELNSQVAQYNDVKGHLNEVNSTKKDLLENMEALKREFVEERKSLQEEIRHLQLRLEHTEDEIEHYGESRENEKTSYDERIRLLESEVIEKQDALLHLEGQVEVLRDETRVQRERLEAQRQQLQHAQDERQDLLERVNTANDESEHHIQTLRDICTQLTPDEPLPTDQVELSEAVLGKVSDMLSRLQILDRDISLLRQELDLSQHSIKTAQAERASLEARVTDEEANSSRLREDVSKEKAKVAALEGELADSHGQLDQLRLRLADGETGSESLRKQLETKEKKIVMLTEELASRTSQAGTMEEEAQGLHGKLTESQSRLSELAAWFESRTEHAKDLTQKLYLQNECLTRLLERLGFSVTRQGSSMTIQKVPRAERSTQSTSELDPSMSLRRSSTLNVRPAADSADLELLYWTDGKDRNGESARYGAYMESLGYFDIDAFCDTVIRRVKDIENIARKWRGYRDKAHALQKDSHNKIAFKHFKEGDLALFLPTKNQATGAWAAFNVGCPHYFLREQEAHRLDNREWIVARISRIQDRVVDLSKSMQHQPGDRRKGLATDPESTEDDNDNPFGLSDGLRWYLIDADEDKPGALSTPGLAKSTVTVAANKVEAMADMHTHGRSGSKSGGLAGRGTVPSGIEGVSKTLSKSLESRRSSTGSRKALPFAIGASRGRDSAVASETNSLRAAPADTPVATSPTQQHAVPQISAQAADTRQRTGVEGEGGVSAGAAPPQQPAQSHSEVRNVLDSLIGP